MSEIERELGDYIRAIHSAIPDGGDLVADALTLLSRQISELRALAPRVGTWLASGGWRCNCDPLSMCCKNAKDDAACSGCWTLRPLDRSDAAPAAASGSGRDDGGAALNGSAATITALEAQLATERERHEAAKADWEASYAHLGAQLAAAREWRELSATPPEYAVRIARLIACWDEEKRTCAPRVQP